MFFGLVSILFAIILDYGNEYMTKEHKNWTGFKNFAPKINLNHNIYKLLIKTSQNLTDRLFNHNETSSSELTQRITIQSFLFVQLYLDTMLWFHSMSYPLDTFDVEIRVE